MLAKMDLSYKGDLYKEGLSKMGLSYKGDDVSTRRQEMSHEKEQDNEDEDLFMRRRNQKPVKRRQESSLPELKIKDWMKDGIDLSKIPMEHRDISSNSVYSKMAGSARTLVQTYRRFEYKLISCQGGSCHKQRLTVEHDSNLFDSNVDWKHLAGLLETVSDNKLNHVDPIFRMETKRLSDKLIILGNWMELRRNFSI